MQTIAAIDVGSNAIRMVVGYFKAGMAKKQCEFNAKLKNVV
jgi:exopolyphosphatase/pppGpp-phosphohydrolase